MYQISRTCRLQSFLQIKTFFFLFPLFVFVVLEVPLCVSILNFLAILCVSLKGIRAWLFLHKRPTLKVLTRLIPKIYPHLRLWKGLGASRARDYHMLYCKWKAFMHIILLVSIKNWVTSNQGLWHKFNRTGNWTLAVAEIILGSNISALVFVVLETANVCSFGCGMSVLLFWGMKLALANCIIHLDTVTTINIDFLYKVLQKRKSFVESRLWVFFMTVSLILVNV